MSRDDRCPEECREPYSQKRACCGSQRSLQASLEEHEDTVNLRYLAHGNGIALSMRSVRHRSCLLPWLDWSEVSP